MKVLMVDQYGETGGAQKCLLDLIAGWPEEGNLVLAAPDDGTLLGSARDLGVVTVALQCGPYRTGGGKAFDAIQFGRDVVRQRATLLRLVRTHSIDLLYVNGPRVLPAAAMAAASCGVPLVFHAHNHLHRRSDRALVRFALGRCNSTVIACCEHVAGPLTFARPLTIPNGVPDAGFRVRRYPPSGPWRIGIAGRISPEKGHALLFEAVRSLSAEGHNISVIVAGATLFSSREHEDALRRQAAGLDVQFMGWVSAIDSALRGLDLLAVPSTAEPGLPRIVLEAFSAGVPVVALPTGGIPEAVRDNITGFLTMDASAAALTERLRDVLNSSTADLLSVIRNARREWETCWNIGRWRSEVVCAIRATANARAVRSDSFAASIAASADR